MSSNAARRITDLDVVEEDELDDLETAALNDALDRADAQYRRAEFSDVESALKRFRAKLYLR